MLTFTILVWIGAFVVFIFNFGWPDNEQRGESAAIMLVLPGCLVGAGLYWDLVGNFPPSGSRDLILFFLFSGIASLGLFSIVALIKLLVKPARDHGSGLVRGVVSFVGLVGSVLSIIGFYLDHLR